MKPVENIPAPIVGCWEVMESTKAHVWQDAQPSCNRGASELLQESSNPQQIAVRVGICHLAHTPLLVLGLVESSFVCDRLPLAVERVRVIHVKVDSGRIHLRV